MSGWQEKHFRPVPPFYFPRVVTLLWDLMLASKGWVGPLPLAHCAPWLRDGPLPGWWLLTMVTHNWSLVLFVRVGAPAPTLGSSGHAYIEAGSEGTEVKERWMQRVYLSERLCYKGATFKSEGSFSENVFLVYKRKPTFSNWVLRRKRSWNQAEYATAFACRKVLC